MTQAIAQKKKITIRVDGKELQVDQGITIIEALDKSCVDLPRYCYHPALSIAGNCRICQVEVENMPRTVIACNTRVQEGMVIHTKSAKAKESQSTVLEFLLANHPLDCPVCDQSGECKLQDYYMKYGLYNPMFNEGKVKKTKKAISIGPTIALDQERCILCSRCVRFTDEITHTHEFGIFNRGDRAELDVCPGKKLDNKYSGNVADICPVGALTDKDFRFKMRVWYLGIQHSVCPGCSRGCNTEIHYESSRPYSSRKERVMRLKPRHNPHVNQWWICDEGRYGYKSIDQGRLTVVGMRQNGAFSEVLWQDALNTVARLLKKAKEGKEKWAVITSPQYTNEELYLQKRLFLDHLGMKHVAFKMPGEEGYEDDFLIKKDKNPNTTGLMGILGLDHRTPDVPTLCEMIRKEGFEGMFVATRDLAKLGEKDLEALRKSVKVLIVATTHQSKTTDIADIVLPVATYAEKEGTFTNFEGRVQRIRQAIPPLNASRPSWRVLNDIGALLGLPFDFRGPAQIFSKLVSQHKAFSGMSYETLSPHGQIWKKT
jgi:NADH-quinone oxidoreductase subunit G